ncbi:MAG: CoA ester lyase [Armatimonadetes bacterium]|nr:CoA ester lyase [Armatimonadota bacterium]
MADADARFWSLRSFLFVPGGQSRMIEKARTLAADAIILDLEDAVAPDGKAAARALVARALEEGFPASPVVLVRVNGCASGLLEDDLAQVVRPRVDGICLPKCQDAQEVLLLDRLLADAERRTGKPAGALWLVPFIESPGAVLEAAQIAAGAPRVAALSFGAEDLAAAMGIARTREGDEVVYPRAHMALAAHAAGRAAIDGVFIDFRDADGLEQDIRRGRSLGYTGKQLIHPSQIEPTNRLFSPDPEVVARARRMVDTFDAAVAAGQGVVVVDGQMVDRPVAERARRMLAVAAAHAARAGHEPGPGGTA